MRRVKIFSLLLIVCILMMAMVGCSIESEETMIGTTIRLKIDGNNSKKAEKDIYNMVSEVERSVSTNLATSTISRINKATVGETIELDDITNVMIEKSYEYYDLSDGAFDISVFPLVDLWQFSPDKVNNLDKLPPSDEDIAKAKSLVSLDKAFRYDRDEKCITKLIDGAMLDLGAVAKGYIADRAREIVSKYDVKEAIIDIGGTVHVYGNRLFRVGIRNPRTALIGDDIMCVVETSGAGVSTSGDYERYYFDANTHERYHHIIDPHTGRPASSGLISVTVVGESAMIADILSTTIFVLGEEKGKTLLSKVDGVDEVILMSLDKTDGKESVKVEKLRKGVEI